MSRPELYRAANLDLLDGARRFDRCDAVSSSAIVAESATVEHSIVGDHVVVEPGAVVIDSVLLAHAVVAAGAHVETSLVMGRVGVGARIVDCMVGADGAVEADAVLVGAAIPEPS